MVSYSYLFILVSRSKPDLVEPGRRIFRDPVTGKIVGKRGELEAVTHEYLETSKAMEGLGEMLGRDDCKVPQEKILKSIKDIAKTLSVLRSKKETLERALTLQLDSGSREREECADTDPEALGEEAPIAGHLDQQVPADESDASGSSLSDSETLSFKTPPKKTFSPESSPALGMYMCSSTYFIFIFNKRLQAFKQKRERGCRRRSSSSASGA